MFEKMKVTNIVRMEKKTNQDKKGPLPWNDCVGGPKMRTRHKDKKKDQVTTVAGKEDDTNPTATKTTATSASSCESDWDDYTADGMMEPRSLSGHTCGFGRRRWVKPARKWRTPAPQIFKKNNPRPNLTQQVIFRHKQLRKFLCS